MLQRDIMTHLCAAAPPPLDAAGLGVWTNPVSAPEDGAAGDLPASAVAFDAARVEIDDVCLASSRDGET